MKVKFTTNDIEGNLVPEGSYSAIVSFLEEVESRFLDKAGAPQKQLKMWFQITDGDYQDRDVIGYCYLSSVLGQNSMLGRWSANILGAAPNKEFDTDDLKGKPCRVSVVHIQPAGNGKPYQKVKDVLQPTSDSNGRARADEELPF
ncbi:MAG: hypothetical protein CL878_13305 [Dehalococcoidia bacterium]|nr:hypothetical protein [Dehalococcoidia bacterium]